MAEASLLSFPFLSCPARSLFLSPSLPTTQRGYFRKRSTRKRRPKHLNLENEATKTRNHCRLNNYNFTSRMTQSESGGGSGCVRTSKGRQNPSQGFIKACKLFNWTFLDRISCINFIISLAILDTSYLNMRFFRYTYIFMWPYFDVCKYARALKQKVWNEV